MCINNKTLAVHYHVPIIRKEDKILCPHYFGIWIDSLAKYFGKVVLICYEDVNADSSYLIQSNNVMICSLGNKPNNLVRRFYLTKEKREIVKEKIIECDVMVLRAPTPLANHLSLISMSTPKIFLLVGNMWRMSKYNELTLVKSFILFLIWYLDHLLLSFFCNRHLTLGIGQYFSKEFPLIRNLKYTFTSTITSTDIVKSPKRLNQKRSFKLLYSGRITYDKGLRNVIIAMSILSKKGVHVEFNILGEGRKELNI